MRSRLWWWFAFLVFFLTSWADIIEVWNLFIGD
jgi:hypothetical protein